MRQLLSPRCLAVSTAVALFTVTALAADSAKPAPAAISPTRIIKDLKNTGPVGMYLPQRPAAEGAEHSLSPYLYVAGGDPQKDQVPLKKTWAEANIAGVIAAVRIHQVFENTGSKTIEAVYVFPASDARGRARHAHEDRRAHRGGEDRAQSRGARAIRSGQTRGQARLAARAGAAQRLHHQRRQHHAGRSHRGRARLQRAAGARGRHLRVRLPDGGRPALRRRRRSRRAINGWPIRT